MCLLRFPGPKLPYYQIFSRLWAKCIPTAIVGYAITLSIAKIFGRKHGYKIDPNQEMIAMGATNIFAGFFQCLPSASELPRSALQETAGGKTQVCAQENALISKKLFLYSLKDRKSCQLLLYCGRHIISRKTSRRTTSCEL